MAVARPSTAAREWVEKKPSGETRTKRKSSRFFVAEDRAPVIRMRSRVEVDKGKSIRADATTRKKRRSETYRARPFPPPIPTAPFLWPLWLYQARPRCHGCEIEADTIIRSDRWRFPRDSSPRAGRGKYFYLLKWPRAFSLSLCDSPLVCNRPWALQLPLEFFIRVETECSIDTGSGGQQEVV